MRRPVVAVVLFAGSAKTASAATTAAPRATTTAVKTLLTTTRDPCEPATHPCVCAAATAKCAWVSFANGGGRCFTDEESEGIDCGLCPSQTKCAGSSCTAFTSACECAASTSLCAWNVDMKQCWKRGMANTPCSACPTQAICKLKPPSTTAFNPALGAKGSGVNDVVQVAFSVEMKWCNPIARNAVSFWCVGSMTQSLGASYTSIMASALNVDISESIRGLTRSVERKCGLTIPADILCDRITSAPFPGIAEGAYSFILSDTSAPAVVGFDPREGAEHVDPNSVVRFIFNEPVKMGPSTLFLTFTTLDTTSSGEEGSMVSSKAYALDVPHVSARGNSTLAFDLKGKTSPGWLYSIALPPGAVIDLSGNKFIGLSGGKYTFRVSETGVRVASSGGGNDMTVFLVALVVGLVVGGVCISALVWKCQGACYSEKRYKRKDSRQSPAVVPVKNSPSLNQVEPEYNGPRIAAAASGFHGSPAPNKQGAAATHSVPVQNSPPAAASRSVPADEWEKNKSSWARSGSPAPQPNRIYPEPTKPDRIYAENSSTFASEPRRDTRHSRPPSGPPPERSDRRQSRSGSKSEAKPEPATKTPTAPVVESTSPEARKVEKQMRSMMNEPLAVRKKMIKDLMLEHHPDKNDGSDSAKETFQYINAARGWFLHDA